MKLYTVAALLLLSITFAAAKPALFGKFCPNMVNCFVNPCQVSRCAAHPGATCVANYCGGCNAVWYFNGKQIDCAGPVEESSDVEVPEDRCIQVNCFMDPCGLAKCKKHPEAQCRANYCGGCNAWFYTAGKRVQCD